MINPNVAYYLDEFPRLAGRLPGRSLPWLQQARQSALANFGRLGFPTLRNEDWKYTNVAAIEKGRFALVPPTGRRGLSAERLRALTLPGAHLMLFIDGRYEPGLSQPGTLPAGAVLTSLARALELDTAGLEALWKQESPDAFTALNTAFLSDGAYLHLPAGSAVEAPIHLLFIASAGNLAIQTRNLIVAEAGSRADIVEHHVALNDFSYLSNVVTRIVVGAGAEIGHHKLQQESQRAFHVATVQAHLGQNSRLTSGSFALGGALARIGIDVALAAEGASCQLDGLHVTDGRQHVDHHTRIDHLKPRGTSRELYKGVMAGSSRAVFNGKVVIHPGAGQSDAFQSNRNLLLSPNAEIDTKPQLEIFADDVKCGHGATVSQLDPDQVFYLCSRGLDDASARALLTRAFADEIIERVTLPSLRQRLEQLVLERLPASWRSAP
jgi:Fe-S cluster assembly protein SufD